jgi:hypothetical protein
MNATGGADADGAEADFRPESAGLAGGRSVKSYIYVDALEYQDKIVVVAHSLAGRARRGAPDHPWRLPGRRPPDGEPPQLTNIHVCLKTIRYISVVIKP